MGALSFGYFNVFWPFASRPTAAQFTVCVWVCSASALTFYVACCVHFLLFGLQQSSQNKYSVLVAEGHEKPHILPLASDGKLLKIILHILCNGKHLYCLFDAEVPQVAPTEYPHLNLRI